MVGARYQFSLMVLECAKLTLGHKASVRTVVLLSLVDPFLERPNIDRVNNIK